MDSNLNVGNIAYGWKNGFWLFWFDFNILFAYFLCKGNKSIFAVWNWFLLLLIPCRLVSLVLQHKNTRLLLKMLHQIYLCQRYKIIVMCRSSSFFLLGFVKIYDQYCCQIKMLIILLCGLSWPFRKSSKFLNVIALRLFNINKFMHVFAASSLS